MAVAIVTLSGCTKKEASGNGPKGPPRVGYVVATAQSLSLSQDLPGRTSAFLVSDVRPQVGGIIRARLFEEGAFVQKGQTLYEIEAGTYRADAERAAAGVAQAQANLEAATTKAKRYKELIDISAISQQDYEDAQTALKQAQATLAVAEATHKGAAINLGYTRVVAPISGRIGKSSVTVGALVNANQAAALATIQDTSKIYVDITQSANDMLALRKAYASGQLERPSLLDVTLTLEDGSVYPLSGKLSFTDVGVAPDTGTVALRAVFANPQGLLLPGMYVRAALEKGAVAQAIMVPQLAVSLDAKGGASLMVVGDDNKAHKRPVVVCEMLKDQWRVISGLKVGDKVITEGATRLKPESDVKPYVVAPKAEP
jgi:membrane fusion protein (multidrug efflux system)